MRHKCEIRRISVMEVQKLPPEKVVELFEKVIEGNVVLISIYHDRWAQIGLKSSTLRWFVRNLQGKRQSAVSRMMRKLSRRWHYEDEEGISAKEKWLDSEEISPVAPPGFHSAKIL